MATLTDSNATDANDNTLIAIGDGGQVDSYARHRVSNSNVLFSAYFSNTQHPLLLNTLAVGAGTATFNSVLGALRLTTSVGLTDSITVQTKKYIKYDPGISYLLGISGIFGSAKSNVRKRWGYFDTTDGLFFEQTSTGIGVVVRTSTSGVVTDTRINQTSWNVDRMDGSNSAFNPSGTTYDASKHNLYIIDFVWQGAGRVRFGMIVGGRIQYVHQINNSNLISAPFMRSPSRPGRVELTNTGLATATTVDVVCFSAIRESNDEPLTTYNFAASNGTTKVTVNSTSPIPILSIRPKLLFNAVANRVSVVPTDFDILSVQDALLVSVVFNGSLTGASFASVNANSATEFDTAATAISGGTIVFQGYVSGGGKGVQALVDLGDLLTLGLDIVGATADIITVTGQKIGANTDSYAAIRWGEFQ